MVCSTKRPVADVFAVTQLEAMSEAEREERVAAVLADLKAAVSSTLSAFAAGDSSPAELKEGLERLGIQMGCSTEQLASLADKPARCAVSATAPLRCALPGPS